MSPGADTLPVDTGSPAVAELPRLAPLDFHAGELAEQRHQFLDLDADSVCPFDGASPYPYLPGGAS